MAAGNAAAFLTERDICMNNVLITGGSRGIGRACVKAFSESGWQVYFTYLNSEEEAQKVSEKYNAVAIRADVSRKEALGEIEKHCSCFQCIVNNAGIAEQKLFTDITEADWDRMFEVNVKGMYLTTHRFVPQMIRAHSGSIINISSVWGIEGASCEVHYSAAKSAVVGFTKALAKELGPSGICVNCVAPGVIDTDMNGHLSAEDMEMLKDETPLCTIGTPGQVAETVLYLANPDRFITGEVIKISGGF